MVGNWLVSRHWSEKTWLTRQGRTTSWPKIFYLWHMPWCLACRYRDNITPTNKWQMRVCICPQAYVYKLRVYFSSGPGQGSRSCLIQETCRPCLMLSWVNILGLVKDISASFFFNFANWWRQDGAQQCLLFNHTLDWWTGNVNQQQKKLFLKNIYKNKTCCRGWHRNMSRLHLSVCCWLTISGSLVTDCLAHETCN